MYSGGKTCTASDSNLAAENIKRDVDLFGVTGTYDGPVYPAPVARTGQRVSYNVNDDGDWIAGVRRTGARFVDHGDGTVTDQLTGLVWLKVADCPGDVVADWNAALSVIDELNSAGTMNGNSCGDTSNGGSHQIDWRLPNINELRSLIDLSEIDPALPAGHPFVNLYDTSAISGSHNYWSSTTVSNTPAAAFIVSNSRSTDNMLILL